MFSSRLCGIAPWAAAAPHHQAHCLPLRSRRKFLAQCLLPLVACTRRQSVTYRRIAVLNFDDLSTEQGHAWIGAALPKLMPLYAAGGAAHLLALDSEQDLAPSRAGEVVRGYYWVRGGRVHLQAALFSVNGRRRLKSVALATEIGQVTAAARRISEALAGRAWRARDPVPEAVKLLGEAFLHPEAGKKLELAEQALRADAGLAPAAMLASNLAAAGGDRNRAVAILQQAVQAQPEGWERAQLQWALGNLERDAAAVEQALAAGLRHAPNDVDMARQLAAMLINRHRYQEGIHWWRHVAARETDQPVVWNALSYAQAYAGDFQGAASSLAQYEKVARADPNLWDSRGEILYMAGRFQEAAESFLQAQEKDARFLGGIEFAKAAFARFMAGDRAGAEGLFARYLESRRAAGDEAVEIRHAHWMYLTANKTGAIAKMSALAQGEGERAAQAGVFAALWRLVEGKLGDAQQLARRAFSQARSPGTANLSAALVFLAQAPASELEWMGRAERMIASNAATALRRQILAYALLLGKHYQGAARLLELSYEQTPPAAADEVRTLLAAAKLGMGDRAGAKKLLAIYPLPPRPGEAPFSSLWFPEVPRLRAAAGL